MTSIVQPPAAETGSPSATERVNHWINGHRVRGSSGHSGPVYNPATGELAREVDFASIEEVDAAVAAAKAAFPGWRATSLSRRTEILFRIRNLVETHKREIAAFLTAE
ncbi:MAG: aldehyde dehydrogenase family protein, partial [Chloroflexota bacterium]